MGTDIYNSVTITGVELTDKQLRKLPEWDLIDGDAWTDIAERRWQRPDGTEHVDPACYYTGGTGRYGDTVEIQAWAVKFTTKHPGATVTYYQEWYESEPGSSSDVYRGGQLVREESRVSGMVPLDLAEMLDQARQVLTEYGKRDPLQSQSQHYASLAPYLAGSLDALVKGLSS